jgi:hypothetical protein
MKEIEKIVSGEMSALMKAKAFLSKRALFYAMEKTTNDSTRNKFYQIYKDLIGYKQKLPEEVKHKKVISEEKLAGKLEGKIAGKKLKKLLQMNKNVEKSIENDKGIPEKLSKLIKEEEKNLGNIAEEKIPNDDDMEPEQKQEKGNVKKKKREDIVMEITEEPEMKKKKKKIKNKQSKTETKKKVTFALGQNTTKGKTV